MLDLACSQEQVGAHVNQPRTSEILGVLYILACPLIVAAGCAIGFIAAPFGMVLAILTPPLAIVVFKRGRRHLEAFGESSLELDNRPMVLFLREFGQEDEILDETSSVMRKTFEQLMVGTFRHLGPVVTLGRPGDRLPPIGALRLYADDEVWQERISDLLGRCCMVIVQANGRHKSMGLLWEISQAFGYEPFKPILVAFAFGYGGVYSERERYLNFKESFEKATSLKLPHETSQYLFYKERTEPLVLSGPEMALAAIDRGARERLARFQRLRGLAIFGAFLAFLPTTIFIGAAVSSINGAAHLVITWIVLYACVFISAVKRERK
jgi:hypothetical protein